MFSDSFRIIAQSSSLRHFGLYLLKNCCYLRLWEQWLDQEALVTSGFRGKSIYGCAAHKSLISILFTTHLRFISICMHSCRRILDPGLSSSIEHNTKQSNLERSGKRKIKSTSKSCRRFLHTTLAVLPKVRLNLGLLGKKLTIHNPDRRYRFPMPPRMRRPSSSDRE